MLSKSLEGKLKTLVESATNQAQTECETEMEQFKQSYITKYDSDIREFSKQINRKIKTDTKMLKDGLSERC